MFPEKNNNINDINCISIFINFETPLCDTQKWRIEHIMWMLRLVQRSVSFVREWQVWFTQAKFWSHSPISIIFVSMIVLKAQNGLFYKRKILADRDKRKIEAYVSLNFLVESRNMLHSVTFETIHKKLDSLVVMRKIQDTYPACVCVPSVYSSSVVGTIPW